MGGFKKYICYKQHISMGLFNLLVKLDCTDK